MTVRQSLIKKNLFAEEMSFQRMFGCHSAEHLIPQMLATKLDTILPVVSLESHWSVIHTKESDGIDDPNEKIAMKSYRDHSNSGIGKMFTLTLSYQFAIQ